MKQQNKSDRAMFATRLGVIATTVGSAVGLGNIWRFPYEAGTHGGGAFMVLYVAFILILGIPVVVAEFLLGREGRSNIFGTFKRLHSSGAWQWVGVIGIVASLMILSFYSVVAGWTLEYFIQSVSGNLVDSPDFHGRFVTFCSGWRTTLWTVIFLLTNYIIARQGVRRGLERMSNIMTPLLFVILLVFCINSLMLPGAREGLSFLFMPDFSKITGKVVLGALGQAFFSLSLGLGCMLTYASYFRNDTNIVKSSTITAGLDTLVAVLSGVMIFPAVFTFGVSPTEGPTLVFEVFPDIFSQMSGGIVWSSLFFLMLFIASLTSTISMSEISITYFSEQTGMSRSGACNFTTLIALVFGSLCALSFGPLDMLNLFNIFDFVSSNILLPVGGMFISIFVGWVLDRKVLRAQLTNNGKLRMPLLGLVVFCLRYVAPPALFVILIMGLI